VQRAARVAPEANVGAVGRAAAPRARLEAYRQLDAVERGAQLGLPCRGTAVSANLKMAGSTA